MTGNLLVISREEVAAHLSYDVCIPLMRDAMTALSRGHTRQLLRSIIDLDGGRAFGVMPGAMDEGAFGAKLISVFSGAAGGVPSHQGMVTLFDPSSGAPVCIVDASEITAIRTSAASAAATDVLARTDATRLAVLGTGEQARRHAEAIASVRSLQEIIFWGRSRDKADALADEIGGPARGAHSVEEAVSGADIICTTTASAEPILFSSQIADGVHLNLVGSSRVGPVEVDTPLVKRARFFADHREGVLRQGAEFLAAKAEGAIADDHILGEIGDVMAGAMKGRLSADDVTIYKSLGSIVQDLASGWYLYNRAVEEGFGLSVPF